jgi:hypothetical protein
VGIVVLMDQTMGKLTYDWIEGVVVLILRLYASRNFLGGIDEWTN